MQRVESKPMGLTGDGAVAEAMRQIDPDQVSVYPITPQTEIVERFAEFVAEGKVSTQLVNVESEHSALSACCGGAAAGGRVMTATASQGLALMHEMLFIASGQRLPIVMPVVNRTISAPINIHCDHSDTMASRDCGWIQIFCRDGQEIYDATLQAVKLAEREDVLLPVMVTLDGFIVSHDMERVEVLPDDAVKGFLGEYEPSINMLDSKHPITVGALALPPYFFEHKIASNNALENSLPAIKEVGKQFGELSGRPYDVIESYRLEDANVAVIALGSAGGTARAAIDLFRKSNSAVRPGLVRIRSYRPFPADDIYNALSNVKAIAVLDRASAPGAVGGPVFEDVRSLFYDKPSRPVIVNYVFGLGGRDFGLDQVNSVFERLGNILQTGEEGPKFQYLGARE
jgi:pyruvate ferredoxin oxidoreductase alpha subunit